MTTSPTGRLARVLVLAGAVAALAFGATPAATAAPAPAPTIAAVDFHGIVALSNCSGAVVRTPSAASTDPALVMSNGHCVALMAAGEVRQNRQDTRRFTLLNSSGTGSLGTLQANRLLYATMTNTDVSIFRLTITYGQLQSQFGTTALTLSTAHPTAGQSIRVVSGFHRAIYPCNIDTFAFRLREDRWTWLDSIRYTSACHTIPGTSGSPVLDTNTSQVVGVNNTLNEQGQRCTLDNPCEVTQNGAVSIHQNIGYAQETYYIAPCFTTQSRLDLTRPGCQLPR
ncbi:serine protease [Actinophytocola sp.]|uniref:S1 family peptidase n=1 Tax=Actinophytocola sp. TaxID=1872138 RepID=UPI002D80A9FB|nr:serine protease [Actinophytocola sp.]HET9139747.1 serine protease [Actinophytocola sp.]